MISPTQDVECVVCGAVECGCDPNVAHDVRARLNAVTKRAEAAEAFDAAAKVCDYVASCYAFEHRESAENAATRIRALADNRARAAAAGTEGQTSGTPLGGDPSADRGAASVEASRARDGSEKCADSREQTGTSPPPCAACGGSGCVDCVGLAPPPAPKRPHLIDGEFQSDKYPTCPRGKVPLSVKDATAQDLLWQYAQRRRSVDAEFADDLEEALRIAGYAPPPASSKAGEDDVEARVNEALNLMLLSEVRAALLSLVRSERRRAYERAAKECERYADSRPSSDPKLDGALSCAARVRALGGEEG